MPELHIAALGSSFAAGPGIGPTIDRSAWRSSNNYPHLLATRLGARLTDLTSSGATLLNILDQPQRHAFTSTPPQIQGLPQDADIVTITAGGNDLGYIGGMLIDAVKASIHDVPLLGRFFPPTTGGQKGRLSIEELTARFIKVIDQVKARAPQATIYLVEYVTVLGTDAAHSPDNSLNDAQIRYYEKVAEGMLQAYETAANARPGVELVRVAEKSKAHGLGSSQPWVTGFGPFMLMRGVVPYHPNALGHQAVADIIYEHIQSGQAK